MEPLEDLGGFEGVPSVSIADAKELCREVYGVDPNMIKSVSRFQSYDDMIYHMNIYPKYRQQQPSCVFKASIICSKQRLDMQCQMSYVIRVTHFSLFIHVSKFVI